MKNLRRKEFSTYTRIATQIAFSNRPKIRVTVCIISMDNQMCSNQRTRKEPIMVRPLDLCSVWFHPDLHFALTFNLVMRRRPTVL
jgi:competence transcription factor ComK